MLKMPSKTTIILIVVIVVIGFIVFIYFIGRRSAKVKIEQVPLPTDQPNGSQINSSDASHVRQISQAIHDDLSGISWGFHNAQPYNDMLSLSDTLFVAVYNDFNNLFSAENDGTMRDWLKSDYAWIGSTWSTVVNSVLLRMDKLGLR
jgi:hypothetical protein